MDNTFIDIDSLSPQELAGTVDTYPWFALAHKRLGTGMASMYMCNRSILFEASRDKSQPDLSDKDVQELLKAFSKPKKVRVAGGDFFSQQDYDSVSQMEGLPNFVISTPATPAEKPDTNMLDQFCTEALAQIFMEQGYIEQAKYIYSKLILQNPEKNAYFAALIAKLGTETKNQ